MMQVHGLGLVTPELRPDQLPTNNTHADRVREFIAQQGDNGATTDEIQCALGLSTQTIGVCMRGLQIKNRITDSGKRRQTRAGHCAVVWYNVVIP